MRNLFPACRWLPSLCVLTGPLLGVRAGEKVQRDRTSSPMSGTVHTSMLVPVHQGPTLVTSVSFTDLLKVSSPNTVALSVRRQPMNLGGVGGGQLSPQHPEN